MLITGQPTDTNRLEVKIKENLIGECPLLRFKTKRMYPYVPQSQNVGGVKLPEGKLTKSSKKP